MSRNIFVAKQYKIDWEKTTFDGHIEIFAEIYNRYVEILKNPNIQKLDLEGDIEIYKEDFILIKNKIDKENPKKYFYIYKTNEEESTLKIKFKEVQELFSQIYEYFDKTNEYIVISYF